MKITTIGEVANIKGGKRLPKGKTLTSQKTKHPYIRIRDMYQDSYLELNEEFEFVDEDTFQSIKRYIVNTNDIIIAIVGTIGLVSMIGESLDNASLTENCVKLINLKDVDNRYLYYFLKSPAGQNEIKKGIVGSTQPKLPIYNIEKIEFPYFPLEQQKKIAEILSVIDAKITLNNQLNANLEELMHSYYKKVFNYDMSQIPENYIKLQAQEYFDISIGKTPPRKEKEWFTYEKDNVKWVSISDMGSCGMFIGDSSEYLIPEAVEKFNMKIIPDNTVILSFKLTVGRLAITDGEMTSNEAIAHFKTNKSEIVEYLYCYLKNFNFETMGSTSSIATAVNSKIIKAMPIVIPSEKDLKEFHKVSLPIVSQIKINQRQNKKLMQIRNVLLPKLMSGDIDLSEVEVMI